MRPSCRSITRARTSVPRVQRIGPHRAPQSFLAECCGCVTVLSFDPAILFINASFGVGTGDMKRLLLATTCAIAVNASPAFSAPVPYVNWTGCYIGGHVGGGTGQKDFSDQFFTPAGSFAAASAPTAVTDGWLAGGQVGCDYQFPNRWVVGIEGAASWANIRGSSDPFFSGKAVFDAQTNWIASTTARVGYTSDRLFLYAKGGPAWAGDRYQVPGTFAALPFNYQGPETRFGWTIGAGVEWQRRERPRNLIPVTGPSGTAFGVKKQTI